MPSSFLQMSSSGMEEASKRGHSSGAPGARSSREGPIDPHIRSFFRLSFWYCNRNKRPPTSYRRSRALGRSTDTWMECLRRSTSTRSWDSALRQCRNLTPIWSMIFRASHTQPIDCCGRAAATLLSIEYAISLLLLNAALKVVTTQIWGPSPVCVMPFRSLGGVHVVALLYISHPPPQPLRPVHPSCLWCHAAPQELDSPPCPPPTASGQRFSEWQTPSESSRQSEDIPGRHGSDYRIRVAQVRHRPTGCPGRSPDASPTAAFPSIASR